MSARRAQRRNRQPASRAPVEGRKQATHSEDDLLSSSRELFVDDLDAFDLLEAEDGSLLVERCGLRLRRSGDLLPAQTGLVDDLTSSSSR